MTESEVIDRFAELYPAAVADSLDELGYPDQVLPASITPLSPSMAFAGVAFPVHGTPDPTVEYEANMRSFLEMLGEVPAGSALAIQSGGDVAAQLGELTTTALQERSCRGAVVDGGLRDAEYILDQEFPAFAAYRTPADAITRWRIEEWNVAVDIGEVTVEPGDILVGDFDGVVSVPRAAVDRVLEVAEATVEAEDAVREAVADGVEPLDAYDRFGTF